MLVVDASFVVDACLVNSGLERLRKHEAVAPPLMWSEVLSVLHELQYRRTISPDLAAQARRRLLDAPIASRKPAALSERTWLIADGFGWAKTYDAEYVALAQLLHCPLLTLDARLQKTASRLVAIANVADL